ncbi:hypothetical protein BCR32DRAFT_324964 [Anaeromyces robustus]|uniref:N-acetyltransferase domain-containing protein n=1 Tax=Anaeromyces robustus TaxID=1754192 RepID=A0A1Y1XL00_9FUNG|nr:hypothetical protein BCR32DRAFT_324964 [Anaeromyces robustus]|eukprot:ORX86431.1 hypothetical protein BCR32DRAFT_324964 [Anaeromyces robustus]
MQELIFKNDKNDYLSVSKYINWNNESIISKALEFKNKNVDEISLIKAIYEYVRDEIKHSWDVQDKRITKSATEVLEQGVGICWGKVNLLAALLRACGILVGICYQRLTLGDTPETGFCIHALNAIYIKSLDKWIRVDARGNKEGVNAQFDLENEKLAFLVRKDIGEVDYRIVYANPLDKLMRVLEENTDMIHVYLNNLPDTVFNYKRATIEDIDELVRTKINVFREVNKLSSDEDIFILKQNLYTYYKQALKINEHIAYIVYDDMNLIGTGDVSISHGMPNYYNSSGKKACIMNIYTVPEYRRKRVAFHILDLLIKNVKEQGISQITLETTDKGQIIFKKYGFVKKFNEMELKV